MSIRSKIQEYKKIIDSIVTVIYIVKFTTAIIIHLLDGIKYIFRAIEKISDGILIFFQAMPDDDEDEEEPDEDEEGDDEEDFSSICKNSRSL